MEPRQALGGLRAARSATVIIVVLLTILLVFGCAPERPPQPPSGNVIVAAGDIADCAGEGDEASTKLVGSIDGATVLPLGDEAYPHGTAQVFRECYEPLWEALYEAGVDVVLSGHEHNYERFAPQDPNGKADPQRGIWEFVVGTGARVTILSWLPSLTVKSTSDESYGVLKLILHPHSYEWQFVPVEGETFTESGSARCN